MLLAALLGLSVWTAAGRAVDAAFPSPPKAVTAAACVDIPQHDDAGQQRAWDVLHGHGARLTGSEWKSQPRLAAFAVASPAAESRVAPDLPARPGPSPAAFAHLHAIPLLI